MQIINTYATRDWVQKQASNTPSYTQTIDITKNGVANNTCMRSVAYGKVGNTNKFLLGPVTIVDNIQLYAVEEGTTEMVALATTGLPEGTYCRGICQNPTTGSWYAGFGTGIYKADVNALVWSKLATGTAADNMDVCRIRVYDGIIYGAFDNNSNIGVAIMSKDDGETWTEIYNDESQSAKIKGVGDIAAAHGCIVITPKLESTECSPKISWNEGITWYVETSLPKAPSRAINVVNGIFSIMFWSITDGEFTDKGFSFSYYSTDGIIWKPGNGIRDYFYSSNVSPDGTKMVVSTSATYKFKNTVPVCSYVTYDGINWYPVDQTKDYTSYCCAITNDGTILFAGGLKSGGATAVANNMLIK